MKGKLGPQYSAVLIIGLLVFVAWPTLANTVEVDWTSAGFTPSQITITTGDEVDIVNFDDFFDLRVTGSPAPNNFYSDIPASDGVYYYYLPYVYSGSGTFYLTDEFGQSATVIVNPATPLSVTITAPTNNAVFSAPATFAVTAVPAGGVTPYAQVQFYAGTNLNAVAYSAPFSAAITNLPAGNHTISVVVTDYNFNTASNSIVVSVTPSQATLAGDWPTYGKGPAHTGYVPGKLNGLPFVLKWKSPMQYAQGSAGNVISQAAIGGGRLYVSVGYYSSGISVRALDANTGQPLWTNWPGVVFLGAPTYDSGAVFVQQDNGANTSYLSSFDASTGFTNWSTPYSSQAYQHMAPVVAGGRIFADTGYYHGVTGFDEAAGYQQWFVQVGGSENWTPAYYNGKVYTWLGSFTEWDPATGSTNWTLTNGLSGAASSRTVAIADGRAYFVGSSLYCVNLATHANAWSASGSFGGTPAIANGIVYAISNKVISAFTTNGVFVRQYDPNPGGYENISGPLIVTDDVLIATGAYGVYVFRLSDGSIQQQISSFSGPPNYFYNGDIVSLANNTLYVTSTDGNVYAYTPASTTPITLTSAAKLGNGSFRFSFTNTPGATFTVWGSTNVALARSSWTKLGYVTNVSSGQYQFTDTNAPDNARYFYSVSSP